MSLMKLRKIKKELVDSAVKNIDFSTLPSEKSENTFLFAFISSFVSFGVYSHRQSIATRVDQKKIKSSLKENVT